MRRFYRQAEIGREANGFAVLLDGKPVRTPKGAPLLLDTAALAQAIAAEWLAQGEKIQPPSMPLLRLANTGIDLMPEQAERSRRALLAYGDTDLLCYFAERPKELLARQRATWRPILDWAEQRYDMTLATTQGVLPLRQPEATRQALGRAVAALSVMPLLVLQEATVLTGSLLLALAVQEGAVPGEVAWAAATLDERFQAETWGEDASEAAREAARRAEFQATWRFHALLRS